MSKPTCGRHQRCQNNKDSIEKNKNNGKMTWQLLNTAINKQKNKTTIFPSSLYDTTGKIYKQTEIPNGFNRFFTSIAIYLEKIFQFLMLILLNTYRKLNMNRLVSISPLLQKKLVVPLSLSITLVADLMELARAFYLKRTKLY